MNVKILFLLTCVFCTIDTRLFVYPSLSRSLLMETGLLAIAFAVIVHCIEREAKMRKDEETQDSVGKDFVW